MPVFIGPNRKGEPLELVVVDDDDGEAIIHAMPARKKSERVVDTVNKPTRAERLAAYERWADSVDSDDLVVVDNLSLRTLRELADEQRTVEVNLEAAVRRARLDNRSWSQIGLMLGVSKQAAQQKYAQRCTVA